MELKNDELQVRIVVPDHPTVRQELAYDSRQDAVLGRSMYERLWDAAGALITEFECPHVALDAKLDDVATPQAVEAIKWTALTVFSFRRDLDEIPKN